MTWQNKSRAHLAKTFWLILSTFSLPETWDLILTFHPPVTRLLYSPDFSLTLSWRWTIQYLAGDCCKTCSTWSYITLNKNIWYKISPASTSISQIFFCQGGSHVLWSEITAIAFSLTSTFWVPSRATTTWNESPQACICCPLGAQTHPYWEHFSEYVLSNKKQESIFSTESSRLWQRPHLQGSTSQYVHLYLLPSTRSFIKTNRFLLRTW